MLREIIILRGPQIIFNMEYSSGFNWDNFASQLSMIGMLYDADEEDKMHQTFINRYKLSLIFYKKINLIFIFITDMTDKEDLIESQLKKAKNEFIDLFPEELIISSNSKDDFKAFIPITDAIHRELRPKIAICGYSGVGKTTTTKLIRADEIPTEHVPTISGEISTIKIGKLHFYLWDFAGQEQFSFLWPQFLKGSDAVLLITDSTLKNIDKSKYFLTLIKEEVPNAKFAVIANKQDLPNALSPEEIANLLEIPKAFGMVAVDSNNRVKMLSIIAELLEISELVSPLLEPLLDRDKLIQEAENALTIGNFRKAAKNFESIAKYSVELGDDKIAQDFFERAKMIWNMIEEEKLITTSNNSIESSQNDLELEEELMELINQEYLELSKESESIRKGIDGLERLFDSIQNKLDLLKTNFEKNIIPESEYKSQRVELLKKSAEIKEAITRLRFKLINKRV